MNETGWFYEDGIALTGTFVKKDFNFSAKHMKLKVTTDLEFSFDGKATHGKLVTADGLVPYKDVNKGQIFIKGSGTLTIQAWDGN